MLLQTHIRNHVRTYEQLNVNVFQCAGTHEPAAGVPHTQSAAAAAEPGEAAQQRAAGAAQADRAGDARAGDRLDAAQDEAGVHQA